MSTHIGATSDQVAPVVLLPGDPRRAQWIAETFLDDAACYSQVRGMLGYTGTWRGQAVSVQGTGMGQPSASIYVHELLADYDVQTLVRVGTCGALDRRVAVRDVVLAQGACTDSAMNRIRFGPFDYAPVADFGLLQAAHAAARSLAVTTHVGLVLSSDAFYHPRADLMDPLVQHGVLAVEMETAALYTAAAGAGRRALSVLTVSDHVTTGEQTSAHDRERGFASMVEIALTAAMAPDL